MSGVSAQTLIRGKILDSGNGDPLIGVSIRIDGTQGGTISDWDGTFELASSQNPPLRLVISYVGYETREEVREENEVHLDILLSAATARLESVGVQADRS